MCLFDGIKTKESEAGFATVLEQKEYVASDISRVDP